MTRGAVVLLLLLLAGCVPQAPSPMETPRAGAPQTNAAPRTLQAIMKVEPASLASRPLTSTGISVAFALRLVNATLDITDGQEAAHPYLARELPKIGADSW